MIQTPPPKLPLPLRGSVPLSYTWFLRPIPVFIQNGISIGSEVFFAQLTVVSHYFTMGSYVFPKIARSLGGSGPHLTHGTYGSPEPSSHHRFSRFCVGPKCCAVQCIVIGEENPQNCPLPLEFRHPARGNPRYGDRRHAQKFGKDRACGSGDMLVADRQTDTRIHRRARYNTSPLLPWVK